MKCEPFVYQTIVGLGDTSCNEVNESFTHLLGSA